MIRPLAAALVALAAGALGADAYQRTIDWAGIHGVVAAHRLPVVDVAAATVPAPPAAGRGGREGGVRPATAPWMADGIATIHRDRSPHLTWDLGPAGPGEAYEVAVGTAPGRSDVVAWHRVPSAEGVVLAGLRGTWRRRYFAAVRRVDAAGAVRARAEGDGWDVVSPDATLAPGMQGLPVPEAVDDRLLAVRTTEDALRLRARLRAMIFGGPALPAVRPTRAEAAASPVAGMPNLGVVERLALDPAPGEPVEGFFLHAAAGRTERLGIFVQGHAEHLGEHGGARTLAAFLAAGWDVLALPMPRYGPPRSGHWLGRHNELFIEFSAAHPDGSPLAAYMAPIRAAVAHARAARPYHDVLMTGISGGGWATTLYAALDEGVRTSVPVAGSLPLFLRGREYGDLEQHAAELYARVGYPDLYVLGAGGPGRRQIQVLNELDPCCYRPLDRVAAYAPAVAGAAAALGGDFEVRVDEGARRHEISDRTVARVLVPLLRAPD